MKKFHILKVSKVSYISNISKVSKHTAFCGFGFLATSFGAQCLLPALHSCFKGPHEVLRIEVDLLPARQGHTCCMISLAPIWNNFNSVVGGGEGKEIDGSD